MAFVNLALLPTTFGWNYSRLTPDFKTNMLLPPWQTVEKKQTLEAASDSKETAHFGHVDGVGLLPNDG